MDVNNFLGICVICIAVVRGQEVHQGSKPIIKSLHINADIKYTYAKTMVTSRILNPADVAQEVNFRVVLPEDAFITGLIMTIKDKSYEAYIKGKEEAKKEYDAAISAGQSAAHVSQDSRFSKDFTVSVNVEPQEKVNFNLTYEELLPRKNKTYKNEINVNPNQIVEDLSVVVNIEDVLNITNIHVPEFNMKNEIDASDSENPSVKITNVAPNKVQVEWNPTIEEQKKLNKEGLNGKMIVKYDVDASKNQQQILVDSDGYFVHIFRDDQLPVLNKHVVFVLDVSGSMGGTKIMQLKEAMEKILLDLSELDYFSIVLFSVKVVAWGPNNPVNPSILDAWDDREPANIIAKDDYVIQANHSNVNAALEFIKSLSSHGGTNIMGGLRNGLKIANLGMDLTKNLAHPMESIVIFLTDGQPNSEESNPDKIISSVEKLNNGVTIFTLGFGSDADMQFLKKLSLSNRGFARKIYVDSDASIQLQNFYKEVASPVLSNIKFEYLTDQVDNVTSEDFKNLFHGSELLVLGRLKPNGVLSGYLTAKTRSGDQKFQIPIDKIIVLPPSHEATPNKTLGRLEKMWAYRTIKSLLDKNIVSKNDSIQNKAKELSLKYSFVTPLTSLVVVKPNSSVPVSDEELREESFPQYGFRPGGGSSAGQSFHLASASLGPQHISHHQMMYILPAKTFPSPNPQSTTLAQTEFDSLTEDSSPNYSLVPYQKVTWLNQTASQDGYLVPPSTLQTADVIALNEANVTNGTCSNGNFCRHFIYCVLAEFADDISKFIPFQCHIETKFVGVCCPL